MSASSKTVLMLLSRLRKSADSMDGAILIIIPPIKK
jgi:hypothetical protein